MTVRLSQVAPWNPRLRNGYRDRFTEVAGRYFMVSADSLDSMWTVAEVDFDGEPLWDTPDGKFDYSRYPDANLTFLHFAARLSEAREQIEEETSPSSTICAMIKE